jgi:hypothetical protein
MSRGLRRLAGIGMLGLILGVAGCEFRHGRNPGGPSHWVRGSGTLATESWDVDGFSGIVVSGGARLIVERTGTDSLTVTAEDNILPYLRAEVAAGRLVLGPRRGVDISPTREIVYRVTCRELSGIFLSGASHAEATGIDRDTFLADLSGASVLVASGRADDQVVHASGASQCRAAELASRTAIVELSGASHGTVRVSERLVADASGGSALDYIGDPELTVNTSGGSLVRQVGH